MKKYLNKLSAIIILIVISLIFFIYYDNSSDELDTKLKDFNNRPSPGTVEISNPIFKNKSLNTNPYKIKAKKGIQIDQDIELYEVYGEFTNDNNELLYVKADKGLYSQANQTIELIGNVLISDELDNRTSSRSAIIDINNKRMSLLDDVISISNTSKITSNSSFIDENSNMITYTGDVKVKIKNR